MLLSRAKNGGKDSLALHIIIFTIIRDETTGNAEGTYHVESPKPKHRTLVFRLGMTRQAEATVVVADGNGTGYPRITCMYRI